MADAMAAVFRWLIISSLPVSLIRAVYVLTYGPPPSIPTGCLILLLMLNSALAHAPPLPWWSAPAPKAMWQIPPRESSVSPVEGNFKVIARVFMALLAACCLYLAACGRLLIEPSLPYSAYYLWVFSFAWPLTCLLGMIFYSEASGTFAASETLLDTFAPLPSLLSTVTLRAAAAYLRPLLQASIPPYSPWGAPHPFGAHFHRAHDRTRRALEAAAAVPRATITTATGTPNIDVWLELWRYFALAGEGAPLARSGNLELCFALTHAAGLAASLALARALPVSTLTAWWASLSSQVANVLNGSAASVFSVWWASLRAEGAQVLDGSAMKSAELWWLSPQLPPIYLAGLCFWFFLSRLTLSPQREFVTAQAAAALLGLVYYLPLYWCIGIVYDTCIVLAVWRWLCARTPAHAASARAAACDAAHSLFSRAACLAYLYIAAVHAVPWSLLVMLFALDLMLQVVVPAELCSAGWLAHRAVPQLQGGPGAPRALPELLAALAEAQARGMLEEDCVVCAAALTAPTPSRLPARMMLLPWEHYFEDRLQPWATDPRKVVLCSCGHVYHALCLAGCEVAQTRQGASARCPTCRSERYASVVITRVQAEQALPQLGGAAGAAGVAGGAGGAAGAGAGGRQRRGSGTRCGNCRQLGHNVRTCPSL